MPEPLKTVGYDQNLGDQVPLDLAFRDEAGRAVKLGDYFGKRPVVLVFAYYHCPMLCDMVLQGVTGEPQDPLLRRRPGLRRGRGEHRSQGDAKLAAETKAETLSRYGRLGHRGRLALPDRRRRTPSWS